MLFGFYLSSPVSKSPFPQSALSTIETHPNSRSSSNPFGSLWRTGAGQYAVRKTTKDIDGNINTLTASFFRLSPSTPRHFYFKQQGFLLLYIMVFIITASGPAVSLAAIFKMLVPPHLPLRSQNGDHWVSTLNFLLVVHCCHWCFKQMMLYECHPKAFKNVSQFAKWNPFLANSFTLGKAKEHNSILFHFIHPKVKLTDLMMISADLKVL